MRWNVETDASCHTLSGHSSRVNSVVYSSKGNQIASGSLNETVRLWDAETGRCQMVVADFNGPVMSVAWKKSSNSRYLVTGSEDKSVRQWQVIKEGDEYKALLCWSSTHEVLAATDTSIQDVKGLSAANKQLLKQRGAVG